MWNFYTWIKVLVTVNFLYGLHICILGRLHKLVASPSLVFVCLCAVAPSKLESTWTWGQTELDYKSNFSIF